MATASVIPPPPPGFTLDGVPPPPPPGFVLDGENAPARIGPVEEPTWMERNVAPVLEKVGGVIERGKPFMPAPLAAVVDQAHKNSPVVQGLADPGTGIAQIIAHLFGQGGRVDPAIQQREREYQSSRGADAESLDIPRIVANALNPLGVKGAGMMKPAATFIGRVAQGTGVGAVSSGSQPVYEGDFADTKAEQVGVGGMLGAFLPGLLEGGKQVARGAYHVIEPYLPGGIERVAGRTANKVTGDKVDDVISALERDERFVPNSRPTAGEAAVPAGSAEFSGLQRNVEPRAPSSYLERDIEQGRARIGAVREVGKDKVALTSAKAERGAAANRNYAAAYGKEIKVDPELAQLAADPFFKRALPMAEDIAKSNKVDAKKDLTRFLHFVKLSIDDKLGKVGEGALGNTERKSVEGVKQRLVAWLEKKNPDYEKARAAFSDASKPINQMEVGQALEKKLEPAINDAGATKAQRADLYSTAVREAPTTIKKATGGPRYQELMDVLTPEQITKIEGVSKDLARSANYEEMGRRGSDAAKKIVGSQLDPKLVPQMLERTAMLINAVLRRVQGTAEGKSLDALAKFMQEPKEMARVMKAANQTEREGIIASLFGAAERATPAVIAAEGVGAGKAAGGEPPKAVPNAPRNKNERVLGATYRTPKGEMEWSENGWLTLRK